MMKMNTKFLKPTEENIASAGKIIAGGGLVAFPTETVYGLGADALNEAAVANIYKAKGRPSDNPLIVHVAKKEDIAPLVSEIPPKAQMLIDAFFPGPITVIMPKSEKIGKTVSGGLDTVGIRMPQNPIARQLIEAAGTPIAAPSANTSGLPSPTEAKYVLEDMNGKIDAVIDGGSCEFGIESTVITLAGDHPVILRPGAITKEMIEEVIGSVEIASAVLEGMKDGEVAASPGMKYKHYAPKGDLVIVEGKKQAVAETINHLTKMDAEAGLKTAVIASDENLSLYDADCKINIGSREHEESIAANLYEVLREMDEMGVQKMYSESFAGGGLGAAIMNRLLKAAGHHVIRV